jgi:MFS family permease
MTKSEHLLELLTQNKLLIKQTNLLQHSQSPWYIKVLLALAGWLAALFFFGFFAVTLLDFSDNASVRAVIGVAMLLAAYFILRSPQSEFLEHVGLAVSLSGQALIAWALFEFLEFKDKEIWLIGAAVQMLLAWFMPSFLHRLFSAFIATYAFSVFMALVGLPALFSSIIMFVCAWFWLHEFQVKQHILSFRAMAYGLTLGLIMIKSTTPLAWLWPEQHDANNLIQWLDEGLNCLILLYVTGALLKRYKIAFSTTPSICALVATLLIGLASMQAPGLASAIMLIVLSFAASHRVLMGLGIMSALFYIAKYYYSLELSLSQKSISLIILGLILLALTKGLALWQQQKMAPGVQPHE